jgi:hypothetical protein
MSLSAGNTDKKLFLCYIVISLLLQRLGITIAVSRWDQAGTLYPVPVNQKLSYSACVPAACSTTPRLMTLGSRAKTVM